MILNVFFLGLLSCFSCSASIIAPKLKIDSDENNWKILRQNLPVSRRGDENIFDSILRVNARERGKSNGGRDDSFLFEGDIDMSLDEVKKLVNGNKYTSGSRGKRAAIKKSRNNLWQKGSIKYAVDRNLNTRAKRAISSAIKEWSKTLPCMGKWQYLTGSRQRGDYMYFFQGRGCYSRVGRVGGAQRVSIGAGCEHHGIAVHEIGHAMGLWHEQSRPDRDSYVTIVWRNIIRGMEFNFQKQTNRQVDSLGVGYDYKSVMHYGSKAFSRNGQATILSKKNGQRLGQRNGLSKLDKIQVRRLYGCTATTTTTTTPKPTACIDRPSHRNWCKESKQVGLCENSLFKSYTSRNCCQTCKVNCVDKGKHCGYWSSQGYCTSNRYKQFMSTNCAKSCRTCRS